jgi:macrolide transport system ATP-binding/permease protein
MEPLLRFLRKLRLLLHREEFTSELSEEMAFHRAQAEAQFHADGMGPEEAHYAALRQFANPTRLREQSHQTVSFRFETALQDIRFSLRQLRKNPGFAFIAVFILALGIGASTAIFSTVNPILFKPLPYPQSNRIIMVWEMQTGGAPLAVTFGTFYGLAQPFF